MNQIRILFLSDTHLGFDYPIRPKIKRRRRGDDFFSNFQYVLEFAKTKRVDLVVHGGDLFFRAKIPQPIVDKVYQMLNEFSSNGIPMVLLPGNHEYSRLPEPHRIDISGIHLIESPSTIKLNIKGVYIEVGGFPFHRKNIRDRFTNLTHDTGILDSKSEIKLLAIHQAVEGAQVGVQNYTFRHGADVVRGKDIPSDVHAVLAGHIHRHQILNIKTRDGKTTPVIYSGSIDRTSFAERNEEKGFYIVEFSKLKDHWKLTKTRFHSLHVRPMIELTINGNEFDEKTLDVYLKTKFKKMDQSSIVRLSYIGPPEEWLVKKLTAGYLRSVSPETMNVTISTGFYSVQKSPRTSNNKRHSQYRLDLFS